MRKELHMSKQLQFSEEAIQRSNERRKRIKEAILGGLKKAKELGIEDMTSKEAESYLKKKEEDKPDSKTPF